MNKLIAALLLVFISSTGWAAKVDTVTTYSASMKKEIKAVVVLPNDYDQGKEFPVVYLLHGYGDNYAGFINKIPAIKDYADQYHLMVVCADGNVSSWYLDSPEDPKWKYETYVSTELVHWVDGHYKTIADRKGRAITGLSMGGHGALSVAFKHQDVFGAAGSMSGGVDIQPFPGSWELIKRLGPYAKYPERWKANSVVELVYLLVPNQLALIIDCGKEDFFYNVNMQLHEKLMYQNIPHDFIIRPGSHDWKYWSNSIGYQFLYFSKCFKK